MSTRCQIGFYTKEPTQKEIDKPNVLLYKHSDGYPEGTLPQLTEFCMLFNEHRGLGDTEYAGARAMQYLTNYADNGMKEYYKETYGKDYDNDFLGYGICGDRKFHGDIEFYYAVSPESIKVYRVDYNYDSERVKERYKPIFTEILDQSVSLKEEEETQKKAKVVSKKDKRIKELEEKVEELQNALSSATLGEEY